MTSLPGSGRLLGLDLGDVRIGVAITDGLQVLATPYSTVKRVGDRKAEFGHIQKLVAENEIVGVVVGEPTNLDGSESIQTSKVHSEVEALEKYLDLPVRLFDERLSSVEGHKSLQKAGLSARSSRDVIDSVAASIILQAYLDSKC